MKNSEIFSNNLKELRLKKDLTQLQLSDILDINRSTVYDYEKNRSFPNLDVLLKISDFFNVSLDELIKKDFTNVYLNYNLQEENSVYPYSVPNGVPNSENYSIVNEPTTPYTNINKIPLVNATAIGGWGGGSFSILQSEVQEHYTIPIFKHQKVDFLIPVKGQSMEPNYRSGDLAACTVINEKTFIQWGKTHIIATKSQGILLKRVFQSEDQNHLTLHSDNPQYPPFKIPVTEVEGMAIVVGSIRID